MSGFPTVRLARHSNIRERPPPLCPPRAVGIAAFDGSVVGSPLLSIAQPSPRGLFVSRASWIFPIDCVAVAISSIKGACFEPGTAIAIGLVAMPADRAPG